MASTYIPQETMVRHDHLGRSTAPYSEPVTKASLLASASQDITDGVGELGKRIEQLAARLAPVLVLKAETACPPRAASPLSNCLAVDRLRENNDRLAHLCAGVDDLLDRLAA